MTTPPAATGFDRGAAVTRSLLGWGVVAGIFYLVFGLILAVTRTGFDLTQHALSLLLLGDGGWLQAVNLVLAGLMTIAAAIGFARAPDPPRVGAWLIGVFGVCLVLSAVFPPDAVDDFPPGSVHSTTSTSAILHLVFGGIGFLCLGAAAILVGGWFARQGGRRMAIWSRLGAAIVVVGFLAGGALSAGAAGVALLWVAVLVGWAWLATASIAAYRTIPHPVIAQRDHP